MPRIATSLVLLLLGALAAAADDKLKGIACRSVHLAYTAPAGTAFYNEVKVENSADGTYFCAIGFNSGYYGIQQLGNGKKLAIFSVWDPAAGNDPKSVPEKNRVKMLFKGEGVRVGRFGGEGTGGQSFFDFDWAVGETYRFLVTAEPDATDKGRVAFSGYLYLPKEKSWKHLVTFSTLTEKKTLRGYYSFIEDFKRNRESTKHVRKAEYGNAWVRTTDGDWKSVMEARFTADSNPVLNIDAGITAAKDRFWLATGGDTMNATTKLREKIALPKDAKLTPPKDWSAALTPRQAAEQAVAELTKALEETPKNADLLSRRGGEFFKLGRLQESIADFDRQIELNPSSAEDHWRRGISLYYAERYEDGAAQFQLGKKVYGNDVENAFWHYLCLARKDSPAKAREHLLKIGTDSRYYMPKVYDLIAGTAKPDDLLKAVENDSAKDKREGYFYTHLYIGLNYEAEGDAAKSLEHITTAVEKYSIPHYMADVARVHIAIRSKKK